MCHGGPGLARAPWVRQLEPTPPYVIDASRRFTAPQLYFILLKGVKMSAMPAWGETRSPAELWNYVAFLEALPSLSPTDYARRRNDNLPAPHF
jgi:mono/diheme cytochrome c family protein